MFLIGIVNSVIGLLSMIVFFTLWVKFKDLWDGEFGLSVAKITLIILLSASAICFVCSFLFKREPTKEETIKAMRDYFCSKAEQKHDK